MYRRFNLRAWLGVNGIDLLAIVVFFGFIILAGTAFWCWMNSAPADPSGASEATHQAIANFTCLFGGC
jgi:hypothetical protein